MTPKQTAKHVRTLRSSLGLTQSAFAELIPVSNVTVCRWEAGTLTPNDHSWRRIELIEAAARKRGSRLDSAPAKRITRAAPGNRGGRTVTPTTSNDSSSAPLDELQDDVIEMDPDEGPGGEGHARSDDRSGPALATAVKGRTTAMPSTRSLTSAPNGAEGHAKNDVHFDHALATAPSEIDPPEQGGRRRAGATTTTLPHPPAAPGGGPTLDQTTDSPSSASQPFSSTGGEGHATRDDPVNPALATAIPPKRGRGRPANPIAASDPATPVSPSPLESALSSGKTRKKAGGKPTAPASGGLDTISSLTQELVALQKSRMMTIKETNGSVSRIEHFIVEMMGYPRDGGENTRKAAFKRARTFRLSVEKQGPAPNGAGHGDVGEDPNAAMSGLTPLILQSYHGRLQWPILRKRIEDDMERVAQRLPGVDFVESVRGLGMLGFAVVCAEATVPISEWRTVSGLWKHMGLAVIDGRRQRGVPGTRKNPEEAMRLFHPKERRGVIYGFLQDSLFRAQWNAGKIMCSTCNKATKVEWDEGAHTPICAVCKTPGDESDVVAAHPAGHYGEVYARRRAHTAPRIIETAELGFKDPNKWTPKRCHNDGTRIMAKALLRDLWRVARGLPPRGLAATTGPSSATSVPPARSAEFAEPAMTGQ